MTPPRLRRSPAKLKHIKLKTTIPAQHFCTWSSCACLPVHHYEHCMRPADTPLHLQVLANSLQIRSTWIGWGVLIVAGGGSYYYAKKAVNADRAERQEQELRRRRLV